MEAQVDTIGTHLVTASFYSENFDKDFKFFVKVILREKKKVEQTNKRRK